MIFRIRNSLLIVTILTFFRFGITILLLLTHSLSAQDGNKENGDRASTLRGSISGICVPYENELNPRAKPEEAHLYNALMRKITSIIIKENGSFSFENLTSGEYIVNIPESGHYEHPVIVSLGENELKDIGEQRLLPYPTYPSFWVGGVNAGVPFPMELGSQYPLISAYKILTVCEYLEMRANYPLVYPPSNRVIIIGYLVQTPDGSWLQQSCGNLVKSGTHNWPDAIFLRNNNEVIEPKIKYLNDNVLKDVGQRLGKDFVQKPDNENSDNIAVAVLGRLTTRDNLVYVKCGEGKTCGFGYGSIAAPAQMEYWQMRRLNQDAMNTH